MGADGKQVKQAGRLRAVRAIGWYIDQYRQAQVSINVIDYKVTPLHVVFETVREEAAKLGLRVTGSELVGLTPLQPMNRRRPLLPAAQGKSTGAPERELVELAVRSLASISSARSTLRRRSSSTSSGARPAGLDGPWTSSWTRCRATRRRRAGGSVAALAGSLGAACPRWWRT